MAAITTKTSIAHQLVAAASASSSSSNAAPPAVSLQPDPFFLGLMSLRDLWNLVASFLFPVPEDALLADPQGSERFSNELYTYCQFARELRYPIRKELDARPTLFSALRLLEEYGAPFPEGQKDISVFFGRNFWILFKAFRVERERYDAMDETNPRRGKAPSLVFSTLDIATQHLIDRCYLRMVSSICRHVERMQTSTIPIPTITGALAMIHNSRAEGTFEGNHQIAREIASKLQGNEGATGSPQQKRQRTEAAEATGALAAGHVRGTRPFLSQAIVPFYDYEVFSRSWLPLIPPQITSCIDLDGSSRELSLRGVRAVALPRSFYDFAKPPGSRIDLRQNMLEDDDIPRLPERIWLNLAENHFSQKGINRLRSPDYCIVLPFPTPSPLPWSSLGYAFTL